MRTLAARSFLVLVLLFGLLFAVGIAVMYYLEMPLWGAIGFSVVIIGAGLAALGSFPVM